MNNIPWVIICIAFTILLVVSFAVHAMEERWINAGIDIACIRFWVSNLVVSFFVEKI